MRVPKRVKRNISLILLGVMVLNVGMAASAQENVQYQETQDELHKIINNTEVLNEEIEKMGSNVLEELLEQKGEYEWLVANEMDPIEKAKLQTLFNETNNLIAEYKGTTSNEGIATYDMWSEVYDSYAAAVTTVIAWFHVKGYKMAAELLTHARYNIDTTAFYGPTNYARVRKAYMFILIANGSATSGGACFPYDPNSTVNDKDLYYGIYHFDYYKKTPITKTVYIFDTYDYTINGEYTGVAGIAVNTMADAQRFGVINPYPIIIVATL